MRPMLHNESPKSQSVRTSNRLFSFRKPKSSTEKSTEKCNKSITESSNSGYISESMISNTHNNSERRRSSIKTMSVVNSRTLELMPNEPRMSRGTTDFYSLPSRGIRKSKFPATKSMINSDTFSQTKQLLYASHSKSPSTPVHHRVETSPSNSIDSLNSSNDPDIVAALDQIASRMGLIEYKELECSDDPVNYLLKTASFNERLSFHKRSQTTNSTTNATAAAAAAAAVTSATDSRVHSPVDQTEPNLIKMENKTLSTEPPGLLKKKISFRKMMQHLSPKSLRRTKSSLPTLLETTRLSRNVNEENDVSNQPKTPVHYQQTADQFTDDNGKNDDDRNDHSKAPILNTIETNRVEDRQMSFGNSCHNNVDQIHFECISTCSKPICEYPHAESTDQESSVTQNNLSYTNVQIPSSPRYVHISLSAFGYGPDPSIHTRRKKYDVKHTKTDSGFLNPYGDQYYSDDEKFNQN